jgi:hypothetical protein
MCRHHPERSGAGALRARWTFRDLYGSYGLLAELGPDRSQVGGE